MSFSILSGSGRFRRVNHPRSDSSKQGKIKWSYGRRASSFAITPFHIDLTTLKTVGPGSTTLEPIGPDGVEDGQEGYAHIGEDGSPHGGQAEDGQNQEEGLNA